MIGFEILIQDPFVGSGLEITYIPGSAQRSTEAIEAIDRTWEIYRGNCDKDAIPVFDGRLFRLHSHSRLAEKIVMELRDTSFREYVGTGTNDFYERHPGESPADPLAVCIALVTSDGRILIEKRTTLTAYRAPYHVIGGFMDRDTDFVEGRPDPFFTIRREVREELGLRIPPDRPVALGLVRNLWIRHPEIVFFCPLDLSLDQVREVFREGTRDNEIDELHSIPDREDDLSLFLQNHHGLFTPSGEACLLLYGKRRFGDDWFWAVFRKLDRSSYKLSLSPTAPGRSCLPPETGI